jgi:hypothetical protein
VLGGFCWKGGFLRPEQTSKPLSTSVVRSDTIRSGDVAYLQFKIQVSAFNFEASGVRV